MQIIKKKLKLAMNEDFKRNKKCILLTINNVNFELHFSEIHTNSVISSFILENQPVIPEY